MAITINAAGGNWSAGGTWVGGIAPTNTDDVDISALTGTLTVNTTTCLGKTLVCGSTAGTLTFTASQTLTISGSVTLSSSMTITGTGALIINATATLTSNGILLTGELRYNAGTITLADNWSCLSFIQSTSKADGNTLTITTNASCTSTSVTAGTTTFKLTGTGTLSTTGRFNNPIVIDSGANTITIGAALGIAGGSLTRNSGTINTTTNSSVLTFFGSATLTTTSTTWYTVNFSGASTLTLGADLTYSNSMQLAGAGTTFAGAFNITGYSLTNNTITTSRTYTFVSGQTYTFDDITLKGISNSITILLKSSIAASQANIVLTTGIGVQKILLVKATDINSSGGEPIRSTGIRPQDLSNTTNWTNNSGQFLMFMR